MTEWRVPSADLPISQLTLDDIVGLQGWTVEDIVKNRAGRLSERQKTVLLAGHRDLFGLVRVGLPKKLIEQGVVQACEGVCREFAGPDMNGPSLKLTVGEKTFFWCDEANYSSNGFKTPIMQVRGRLLAEWANHGQRVRVYYVRDDEVVAFEPM